MKNKTTGARLECAAAAAAIVTGIVLLIYSNSVKDPNALVPALLILGGAVAALAFITEIHFVSIFPGVFFMAALAAYLGSQLGNIAGRLSGNGIGLTGTSLPAIIVFSCLTLLAAVLAIISAFLPSKK